MSYSWCPQQGTFQYNVTILKRCAGCCSLSAMCVSYISIGIENESGETRNKQTNLQRTHRQPRIVRLVSYNDHSLTILSEIHTKKHQRNNIHTANRCGHRTVIARIRTQTKRPPSIRIPSKHHCQEVIS